MKKELQPSINWEIRIEELLTSNNDPSGKRAIFRNDNNAVLGIVGKDYCPLNNSMFMEFTSALTKTGEFELAGFDELNNGKIILAFLKNKNSNLKLNGCNISEYLVAGNSHDGTRPFYIGTASTMVRCENQFYSTLKVFRQKHISPISFTDSAILELISDYNLKKTDVYNSFNGMEHVAIDESVIDNLVKDVHKMLAVDSRLIKPEELGWSPSMIVLRESIEREIKDLGNNAFGLFNGVTWYTSHEMRNAGEGFGRIDNTANLINQKAFNFCNNLKN